MTEGQHTSGLATTQSASQNLRAQPNVAYADLMKPDEDWVLY